MKLENILVDPSNKTPLTLDYPNNTITGLNTELFDGEIDGNIPIILPKLIVKHLKTSAIHKQSNTNFNYLEHYQKDAETFDYFKEPESAISRDENKRLNQTIIKSIPKNANIILDVGCGNGWLSKNIQSNNNHVISMDITPVNPKKSLLNQPHPGHWALVADAFHLPIADESIDCIVASEIMEHVSNPKLFIISLLKTLKKNGKLIITTPYNESIPKHLCIHCNHLTPENAHLHSFNENNIPTIVPKNVQSLRMTSFGHKYMPRLKFYLLIKNWPFVVWKMIDNFINKIWSKPMRLMIVITK